MHIIVLVCYKICGKRISMRASLFRSVSVSVLEETRSNDSWRSWAIAGQGEMKSIPSLSIFVVSYSDRSYCFDICFHNTDNIEKDVCHNTLTNTSHAQHKHN